MRRLRPMPPSPTPATCRRAPTPPRPRPTRRRARPEASQAQADTSPAQADQARADRNAALDRAAQARSSSKISNRLRKKPASAGFFLSRCADSARLRRGRTDKAAPAGRRRAGFSDRDRAPAPAWHRHAPRPADRHAPTGSARRNSSMPALALAQHFAGAAQLQIHFGDDKAVIGVAHGLAAAPWRFRPDGRDRPAGRRICRCRVPPGRATDAAGPGRNARHVPPP